VVLNPLLLFCVSVHISVCGDRHRPTWQRPASAQSSATSWTTVWVARCAAVNCHEEKFNDETGQVLSLWTCA